MRVTVFDASGHVTYRGLTSANATFATGNLPPGNYVVQFNSDNAAVKGNQYLVVVSAGKKKVIATDVSGKTFLAGGAAMRLEVGRGSKITGQVANEQSTPVAGDAKYRIIGGQRFVWVSTELGSNLPGRWVEEGLAPARNIALYASDDLRKRQDHAGEGSMLNGHHHPQERPTGL